MTPYDIISDAWRFGVEIRRNKTGEAALAGVSDAEGCREAVDKLRSVRDDILRSMNGTHCIFCRALVTAGVRFADRTTAHIACYEDRFSAG